MSNGLSGSFNPARLLARVERVGVATHAAVRPAAQAGAQVYYDEVERRVPVDSGELKNALYQAYADESTPQRAVYRISWNKKKAFHGHFIENGTSKMAAQPFLRPAYDARREDAIATSRDTLHESLNGELGK